MTTIDPQVAALLKDPAALIPAIVQDLSSNEVLMLAYMNAESLSLTLSTGKATYWSRSRNELWVKGATSGHFQDVHSVSLDCDGDANRCGQCMNDPATDYYWMATGDGYIGEYDASGVTTNGGSATLI